MQVAAAIVSYNPTAALPRLVETLVAAGIPVEVVDNASSTGLEHLLASRDAGATVTTLDTNTGVAGALETALDATDAEWLLTCDQDSVVTSESIAQLVGSAATQSPTVAIVGPLVLDQASGEPLQGDPTAKGWYEVERVITSGALCRVVALRAVGGFRTDLVIDFVDWDLCVRLRKARWLIAIEPAAILEHSIGRATIHHVPLVGDVTTTNHNPDRQYYKYRNFFLLARAGKLGPDTRWSLRTALGLGLGLGKVLAFEDDKAAKLGAIAAGVRDGVTGRTGSRGAPRVALDAHATLRQAQGAEPRDDRSLSLSKGSEGRPPVSVCMATYNGAAFLAPAARLDPRPARGRRRAARAGRRLVRRHAEHHRLVPGFPHRGRPQRVQPRRHRHVRALPRARPPRHRVPVRPGRRVAAGQGRRGGRRVRRPRTSPAS